MTTKSQQSTVTELFMNMHKVNFKNQFKRPNVVRLCSKCGEEQHIDQEKLKNLVKLGWSPSHGSCQRHFLEFLTGPDIKMSPEKAKTQMVEMKAPFCSDLSLPDNKPMLNWLLNPTPHPSQKKKQLDKAA